MGIASCVFVAEIMIVPGNDDADPAIAWCRYAWLAFGAVWLIAAIKTKPAVRMESSYSRLAVRLGMILAYVLLFVPWSDAGILTARFSPGSGLYAWPGFALTVAGVAIAFWARFYLGGNWSSSVTVKQNHELIRSGPYAMVRHPIYTGILLAVLGTAIAVGQIRGLIALVIAAIALRAKSRIEEAFMQQEFPGEYPRYMREVKAIVPLLW